MAVRVEDLMLSLEDYAVVDRDATVFQALKALESAQERLPPGRQPHRAILVRGDDGKVIGKLHHFALLRALIPGKKAQGSAALMERAGVDDSLMDSSMKTLDLLTGDLMDVCERARHVRVGEVYSPLTASIDRQAPLSQAVSLFLRLQTLSLLVTRNKETVGILRLSDLFDTLAQQITRGESGAESR
jgi:hypothetical protein